MPEETRAAIYVAEPPSEAPERFHPWELRQVEESARIAHRIAFYIRQLHPGWLVGVRLVGTGEPVWPDGMANHYDLPPYSDPVEG